MAFAGNLLIVPYGIETSSRWATKKTPSSLLIVPYGIETLPLTASTIIGKLLIVPYGIETQLYEGC